MLHRLLQTTRAAGARRAASTFRAADTVVHANPNPGTLPPNSALKFGQNYSDHMLFCDWTQEGGWKAPRITEYGNLSLSPACSVLHYAMSCFEGMKAYRDADGQIRLFRPEMNTRRFQTSMSRLGMPEFDQVELAQAIANLIKVDENWVPEGDGYSLYIRPTAMATNVGLGLAPPTNVSIFTILSPSGPYYSDKDGKPSFAPVKLYADKENVRAWPGGVGANKVGGNYGPTIAPQMEAAQHGCAQTLWLFDDENSGDPVVTESGTMNFFVVVADKATGKPTLFTAPLGVRNDILPGVTRDSCLHLARGWAASGGSDADGPDLSGGVQEQDTRMSTLVEAFKDGRVLEAFGAGTAAIISPVSGILYEGVQYDVPTGAGIGPVSKALLTTLGDIQYGRVDHEWSVKLEDVGAYMQSKQ